MVRIPTSNFKQSKGIGKENKTRQHIHNTDNTTTNCLYSRLNNFEGLSSMLYMSIKVSILLYSSSI